ncbi:HAMP domain-containing protein [Anabaena minutissima FACHB-250]|nr:HAMP domain-containing protein [Anabaena minutissima FACHB-250]
MTHLGVQRSQKLPLRFILIVPFIMQIFATVGLVGYLSFRNGQKAVNELANQLMIQVNLVVDQHLDTYLTTPDQLNKINLDAVEMGMLNLSDFQATVRYFAKQMQVFNVGYISFANSKGEFIGVERLDNGQLLINEVSQNKGIGKLYVYTTDSQVNRQQLIAIKDYDPRLEAWYKDAVKVNKPVWSQIYQWEDKPEILSISSSYPLNQKQHKFTGVLSVDLILSQISNFLADLKIGKTGKIFILERSGLIVATSADDLPFKVVNGKAQRLSALNSKNILIQSTTKYIQHNFGKIINIKSTQQAVIKIQDKNHFVQITPWHNPLGLDWVVVVVVPESEFMAQISTNTRTTILLCLGALILATALGIYTSRWITNPILKLTKASSAIAYSGRNAIASGELEQTIAIFSIHELSILAQSFNQMADQLRQSFTFLEITNQELEQRVAQRTAEITAAKEVADAANHAKSEFLANISHELRTPLNGILGYAQILQFDPNISDEQMEGVNIIYDCGFHLLNLINDILDIAKIESKKMELYPESFDFKKFLLGVFHICRVKAEQKSIDFICQVDHHLPTTIQTDEKRLRQVLINLLGNAIKFTQHGTVTFLVEVIDNYKTNQQLPVSIIRFQIIDTGIGMTNEQLKTIFLPFEQVGNTLKKSEGTGLGLAISYQIVEMMGGEIKVESIYNHGSKFWFDLDLPVVNMGIISDLSIVKENMIGYNQEAHEDNREIIFPPSVELIKLYQASKAGYIVDIQEEISRIQKLDEKYNQFSRQVLQLLEEFDDEVIVKMIQPYLDC